MNDTQVLDKKEEIIKAANKALLCPICLQKKENCIYFKRLLEEECAYFLHLMMMSMRQKPLTVKNKKEKTVVFQWVIAAIACIAKQSTPVPGHYHDEHIPAHWETQANYSADLLPATLNSAVNYELAVQWLSKSATHVPRHTSTHQLRLDLQIQQALQKRRIPVLVPPVMRPRAQTRPTPTEAIVIHLQTRVAPKAKPIPVKEPLPVCSITLAVPSDPAKAMPCGHVFSHHAINRWVRTKPNACCPNCRQPIRAVKKIEQRSPVAKPSADMSTTALLLCARPTRSDALAARQWLLRHQSMPTPPAVRRRRTERSASVLQL